MIKQDFEIGDMVCVSNPGKLYSSYDEAARGMNLKRFKIYYSGVVRKEREYIVIGTFVHHYTKEIIYGITDSIHDFIMGGDGLELIKRSMIPDNTPICKEEKFDTSLLYDFEMRNNQNE